MSEREYASAAYKPSSGDFWVIGELPNNVLPVALGVCVGDPRLTYSYIEVSSLSEMWKLQTRLNAAHLQGERDQLRKIRIVLEIDR